MEGVDAANRVRPSTGLLRYLRALWQGERPLSQVFWSDMIVIGTLVNVLASVAALLLIVSGAPVAVGVFAHFAPLPYNILLFLAVWRSAARETSIWSFAAQPAALVWLIVVIVV